MTSDHEARRPQDRRERRRGEQTGAAGRSTRLAGVPFILVLLAILGLGMAAVLVLNTSIQQQESTLEDLRAQAQASGYHQDLLQGEVDQLGTTNVLAAKAANLGMVPNPNPVIIQMPAGQIHGTPQAAVGTELPGIAVPSSVPSASSQISIVAGPTTTASSTPTGSATTGSASPADSGTPPAAPSTAVASTSASETPTASATESR